MFSSLSQYHQKLFARLINSGSKLEDPVLSDYKRKTLSQLSGAVVEIGAGTGGNLKYYPKDIDLTVIEPNAFMFEHFRKNAEDLGFNKIKIMESAAEHIKFPDNQADYVVSTHVLCSVASQGQVVEEIRRILKPGGKFIFIEHVASRSSALLALQKVINPLWRILIDGCNLDRDTLQVINESGFSQVDSENIKIGKHNPTTPHLIGTAVK